VGSNPRSNADGFDSLEINVELVLDVGDDLDKPGELDAQLVPVGDGVDVLVLRRLRGLAPGCLGHGQQLERHAVNVHELRLGEIAHLTRFNE
jgi:hypothetical protein